MGYKYIIRDREAGNAIEWAETIEEAKEIVKQYEKIDKKDGNYTPNFYEIYNKKTNEII